MNLEDFKAEMQRALNKLESDEEATLENVREHLDQARVLLCEIKLETEDSSAAYDFLMSIYDVIGAALNLIDNSGKFMEKE